MNIRVIALSAALLCSTSAFAQNTSPATSPDNGATAAQTNLNNPNTNNPPINSGHAGNWGLWGLFGLFGFFGLARGGGRRDEAGRTTTNLPPK